LCKKFLLFGLEKLVKEQVEGREQKNFFSSEGKALEARVVFSNVEVVKEQKGQWINNENHVHQGSESEAMLVGGGKSKKENKDHVVPIQQKTTVVFETKEEISLKEEKKIVVNDLQDALFDKARGQIVEAEKVYNFSEVDSVSVDIIVEEMKGDTASLMLSWEVLFDGKAREESSSLWFVHREKKVSHFKHVFQSMSPIVKREGLKKNRALLTQSPKMKLNLVLKQVSGESVVLKISNKARVHWDSRTSEHPELARAGVRERVDWFQAQEEKDNARRKKYAQSQEEEKALLYALENPSDGKKWRWIVTPTGMELVSHDGQKAAIQPAQQPLSMCVRGNENVVMRPELFQERQKELENDEKSEGNSTQWWVEDEEVVKNSNSSNVANEREFGKIENETWEQFIDEDPLDSKNQQEVESGSDQELDEKEGEESGENRFEHFREECHYCFDPVWVTENDPHYAKYECYICPLCQQDEQLQYWLEKDEGESDEACEYILTLAEKRPLRYCNYWENQRGY
jgi:hypothetical protein